MKAFPLNGRPIFQASNQFIELRIQDEQMNIYTGRVDIPCPNGHYITTSDLYAAVLALAEKIPHDAGVEHALV